jgi:hypothetical protein
MRSTIICLASLLTSGLAAPGKPAVFSRTSSDVCPGICKSSSELGGFPQAMACFSAALEAICGDCSEIGSTVSARTYCTYMTHADTLEVHLRMRLRRPARRCQRNSRFCLTTLGIPNLFPLVT